jgi:hypothetical protein
MKTRLWLAALSLSLLLAGTARGDADSTRAAEIVSCLPGESSTWGDGVDRPVAGSVVRLVYRHAGAPPWFSEALVLGALQRAAAAWSGCGIRAEVIGEEAARLHPGTVTVVQWNEAESVGHVALANVGLRRLSINPAVFKLLAERNPRHPAAQSLQMAISHELGHFFGLMAHSRRCVDVMSRYGDGRGETCRTRDGGSYRALAEYRALLPTACDIARCRALNGTGR